jgi:hypothetical protein
MKNFKSYVLTLAIVFTYDFAAASPLLVFECHHLSCLPGCCKFENSVASHGHCNSSHEVRFVEKFHERLEIQPNCGIEGTAPLS